MRHMYILLIIPLFFSCDKEEIKKNHAEALPSFSGSLWEFNNVGFQNSNEGFIDISLFHNNDTNELIDNIILMNLPIDQDSIHLFFQKDGASQQSTKPTAYYYITVGPDALGESYVIDSTKEDSYVILDCVSKNKVTGRFRLNYVISPTSSLPKFAPYIPDTFFIADGIFNARR